MADETAPAGYIRADQSEEAAAAREQQQQQEQQQSSGPVTVTVSSDEPSDEPPSYDSVFKRVKAAREESDNVGFVKALPGIFCDTIGCTICLGIFLAIPISMIVMGAVYLEDCPVQRFIPIYLVVGGVFALWENIAGLIHSIYQKKYKDQPTAFNRICNVSESLIGCFTIAWFFAGNFWIYSTFKKFSEDPEAVNYCNPTLYWYAFWLTTAGYILLGIIIVGFCVVMCCVCCAGCCAMCLRSTK